MRNGALFTRHALSDRKNERKNSAPSVIGTASSSSQTQTQQKSTQPQRQAQARPVAPEDLVISIPNAFGGQDLRSAPAMRHPAMGLISDAPVYARPSPASMMHRSSLVARPGTGSTLSQRIKTLTSEPSPMSLVGSPMSLVNTPYPESSRRPSSSIRLIQPWEVNQMSQ
jgi:hypothetical protein